MSATIALVSSPVARLALAARTLTNDPAFRAEVTARAATPSPFVMAQIGEVVHSDDLRVVLAALVSQLYDLRDDDWCQQIAPYVQACGLLEIDAKFWREAEYDEAYTVINALSPFLEEHAGDGVRFGQSEAESSSWGFWTLWAEDVPLPEAPAYDRPPYTDADVPPLMAALEA